MKNIFFPSICRQLFIAVIQDHKTSELFVTIHIATDNKTCPLHLTYLWRTHITHLSSGLHLTMSNEQVDFLYACSVIIKLATLQ